MELADSMALAFRNALAQDELASAMAKAPVMPRPLGIRKLERSINVLTRENGINPQDCR